MPKSYDPKILAYLKKPDNLPFVLEIGEYALKIREDMPNEVWCDIVKGLNASRLKPRADRKFNLPANADLEKVELHGRPSQLGAKTAQQLVFDIEMVKFDEEFYIWIGTKWQAPEKTNSPTYRMSEIIKLRTAMENDQDGYQFDPPYWVCGRYTWPPTSKVKFVSECAESKDKIVETTVTSFWRMVHQHWAQLEKANKALRRFKK